MTEQEKKDLIKEFLDYRGGSRILTRMREVCMGALSLDNSTWTLGTEGLENGLLILSKKPITPEIYETIREATVQMQKWLADGMPKKMDKSALQSCKADVTKAAVQECVVQTMIKSAVAEATSQLKAELREELKKNAALTEGSPGKKGEHEPPVLALQSCEAKAAKEPILTVEEMIESAAKKASAEAALKFQEVLKAAAEEDAKKNAAKDKEARDQMAEMQAQIKRLQIADKERPCVVAKLPGQVIGAGKSSVEEEAVPPAEEDAVPPAEEESPALAVVTFMGTKVPEEVDSVLGVVLDAARSAVVSLIFGAGKKRHREEEPSDEESYPRKAPARR
jgi:hypothetical protein